MRPYQILTTALLAAALLGPGGRYAGAAAPDEPPPQWTKAEREKGYVVFSHSTLEGLPRSYVPAREAVGGRLGRVKISCVLARGEYEALQIGIHAVADGVKNVRLEVESDLEVRVFRRIDGKVRKMLLGYSNPVPAGMHDACLDESNSIDSIGKGRTDPFWLTFHADRNAVPGKHPGKIRIQVAGRPATELDLVVTVRPFVLQRARIAYFPFFYVNWLEGPPGFAQTDEWIRALYRDMAEHSHTSVTFYGYPRGPGIDLRQLPPPTNPYMSILLPMAKEVGLITSDVPCISWVTNLGPPESEGGPSLEQKNRGADWIREECRRKGWPELVSYDWDEPRYPYPEFREHYAPLRDVRTRFATAMSGLAAYGHGDVVDVWIVSAGQITHEMCAEAQRLGAEVWTYSTRVFATQPLKARYLAGLYVWAYRLKGHTTWHHYAQGGYKNIWMREGDKGPMPMTGWETRREGIDDYRYLQMLEDSIARDPDDPVAVEADHWLDSLRKRITVDPHRMGPGHPLALEEYDQIRERAARSIERLGPVPPERIAPRSVPRLKDEARPLRGKSVQECIAGLRSKDATVRRAAAWVLFEMGPQAAGATEALADLLDDREVRMPALRALEAIGPEISPAVVPQIAALMSDLDGFVRLGTTMVLGQAGPAAAEPLRAALKDEFPPRVLEAAKALARLGPVAKVALPEAMELLGHPTWQYHIAALKILCAVGPEKGAQALPKVIECYLAEKGGASEAQLLSSFGPAAAEAIPALEKYATPSNFWSPYSYQALFYIRGESADLENMLDLLKRGDLSTNTRGYVISILKLMGVKARPVEGKVRELLTADEVADKYKAGLREFLKMLEEGKQPDPVMP